MVLAEPAREKKNGAEMAGVPGTAAAAGAAASRMNVRLETLRERRGDMVRLDEIAAMVEEIIESLEGDLGMGDVALHRELAALVGYINHARGEIAAISPAEISAHHIPVATDELDAVVQATETATATILDAAELASALADELDGPQADRLRAIVTSIYEASNFQDITGQRITKVVRTLRYIEAKVVTLVRAFGQDIEASPEALRLSAEVAADDRALLNGPQLPNKANSQDEIDALLASFD